MTRSAQAIAIDGWPDVLPGEAELAASWGRDCLYTPGDRSPFKFGLQDIHDILCDGRTTAEQVAISTNNHTKLNPADYTLPPGEAVRLPAWFGRLDLAKVAEQLSDGASLVLYKLQECHRELRKICRQIQSRTGRFAEAVGFLSPPGRGALPLHQDLVDVIVIQTYGSKRWRIFEHFLGQDEHGSVTKPADSEPSHRLTLTPGDTFYMPTGRPHQALSTDDWSIHVSITVWAVSPSHAIEARLSRALSDFQETRIYPSWAGEMDDRTDMDRVVSAALDTVQEVRQEWGVHYPRVTRQQDHIAGILGIPVDK